MRVISMHKVDAAMEAGGMPSRELIQGMGKLIGEMRRAGAFLDGEGLRRSATRVRLRFSGGERTLQNGPYAGSNELVAGVAMLKVRDMDDAIGWATRYAQAIGEAELEIGPVTEGWDLGVMAKPADAPLRCLLLHKADADSEAGKPLPKTAAAALTKLTNEMTKAGVLLASERLGPSSQGARMKVAAKRATVVDGPFAESKELIAGYVMLEVPSLQVACEWGTRFADVIGDVELDILPLRDDERP
jgi:hypothetical protein